MTLLREAKQDAVPTVAFLTHLKEATVVLRAVTLPQQVYAQPAGQLALTGDMQVPCMHSSLQSEEAATTWCLI
jgi:hypothetical protein